VNTLLIIDVHARDIVDGFVRESILHAKEFAWESQLRFYWDRSADDCVIKQVGLCPYSSCASLQECSG
jgi:dynein heavy chain, axonemal